MKKVKFGNYWKDTDEVKEPIEWLVLDEKDGKTLLLAKHGLDCRQYHYGTYDTSCSTSWSESDLRKWLHSTFINNAFSEEEQQAIIPTQNKTNDDVENVLPSFTEDKVFLLSIEEANKYLTQEERKCRPTPYAKLHNAWSSGDNFCYWWLRSPVDIQGNAAYVYYDGDVHYRGSSVYFGINAIRVAMWVDSSKMLESKDNA
jgi:hypothetical protein